MRTCSRWAHKYNTSIYNTNTIECELKRRLCSSALGREHVVEEGSVRIHSKNGGDQHLKPGFSAHWLCFCALRLTIMVSLKGRKVSSITSYTWDGVKTKHVIKNHFVNFEQLCGYVIILKTLPRCPKLAMCGRSRPRPPWRRWNSNSRFFNTPPLFQYSLAFATSSFLQIVNSKLCTKCTVELCKVCRTCLINPVWLTSFKDQKHFCWPLSLFNPLICRWLENFYILNTFWYWQSKLCWSLSMIPINIDSCQIKRLLSFISVTLASTSHNWQLNMDFPNKHIFGYKSTESGALKIIKTI